MQAVDSLSPSPIPTETLTTLKQLCDCADLAHAMSETGGLASVGFAGEIHARAQQLAQTFGYQLVLGEQEHDVLCDYRPRYVAVQLAELPDAEPHDERVRRQRGQGIAEYAVMLAVILVVVVGTVKLIGSNAQTVFSQTASSISGQ